MSDGIEVYAFPAANTAFLHDWWQVALWSRAHIELDTFPSWETAQRGWTTPAPGRELHFLLARVDGAAAGAALLASVGIGNPHLAYLEIYCLPDRRRRGIASALLAEAEPLAAGLGRHTLMGEVTTAPGADGAAASPGLAFVEHHGFARAGLEEKKSVDLLATEELWSTVEAEAAERSAGYKLVWWGEVTPEELVEPICALYSRFLAEAPTEDLDLRPEPWDAARVRAEEARDREIGRRRILVAARAPDGSLVGYTEAAHFESAAHRARITGTLVLPEHRGHALGLALKVRLHRLLREQWPDCLTLLTGNAGVNAHMNAVNERLGYRVVEVAHDVQKVLPQSEPARTGSPT